MIRRISFLLLSVLALNAAAENLGQKGDVYQTDRDGRDQLKDIVRKKQQTGEVDKFWRSFRDRNVDAIKNPAPLGVASRYGYRLEERELKFTFPQDVKNERNQVVVPRGTVVEPLKIQPLTAGLIFIDGRDQKQVDYAIARGRKQPLKIVLTAGSPYDLRVKYKDHDWWGGTKTIPFYFDQRKMIIDQLQRLYGINISSVPATLYQRGDRLAIEFGVRP
jgi:conjugal transfer pilus assembly protein TraW